MRKQIVTVRLDKSLLAGFWLHAIKEFIHKKGAVNPCLFGSAILPSIAMGFQYFAF